MKKKELSSVVRETGGLDARAIRQIVGRDDPVILEIGSNNGSTTAGFLKQMPNARIFCFEPEPRALALFKKTVNHPNVKLFECAVGNRNGQITFHQSSGQDEFAGWHASGSIRPPKEHLKVWPKVLFEDKIEVPIIRLDDWSKTQEIDRIDFIWADVQGAEGDLILGGLDTINKSRFFYTEYNFQELYEGQIPISDINALLRNFSVKQLFSDDVLFENMRPAWSLQLGWKISSLARRLVPRWFG